MQRLTSYERDGLTFDVVDSGPIDGDVVVLLHGFPQSAASWSGVTARLNAAGLRTIAPNQRGYSPGARPRGRRAYRMSELVADVVALIDGVGRRVHLVGHDWGAANSWMVATKHPDRLHSLTALSVSHPAAFRHALLTSRQILLSWYMGAFQVPLIPELALDPARLGGRRRFVAALRASRQPREAAERDAAFFRGQPGAFTAALNWYRAIPFADQRVGGRVTVPTTFVWSDGDTALLRPDGKRVAEYVDAPYHFEELRGVSHWMLDEVPDRVAELVLERVESVRRPAQDPGAGRAAARR